MDSVSWGLDSEAEECFDEHPVEVVCDTTSMMLMEEDEEEEEEALSPLFNESSKSFIDLKLQFK
jgi:hypothetical protein